MADGLEPTSLIGLQVLRWANLRGLSRIELARRTGLTRKSLEHCLAGRSTPTVSTMLKLASVLDVSLAELVPGIDELVVLRDSRLGRVIQALSAGAHAVPEVDTLLEVMEPLDQHAPYVADLSDF